MWTRYLLVIVTFWLFALGARAQHPQQSNNSTRDSTIPAAANKANMLWNKILTHCSNEVSPVCATNGGDYMLLPNVCALREINRQHFAVAPTFIVVAMNFCRPKCELACDALHKPICVYDKEENIKRTFKNICEIAIDTCLNETVWLQHSDGACSTDEVTKAPKVTVAPTLVTSSFRHKTPTFKLLPRNLANSESTAKPKKSIPCPKVFNPVCATFAGVKSTFINECLVNAENVKTGKVWEIFSQGVCEEDYSRRLRHVITTKSVHDSSFHHVASFSNDVIFAPPIVHTQYVDENVLFDYHQHNRRQVQSAQAHPPPFATVRHERFQALMPVRVVVDVDDKVPECKFGAIPICGTLRSRTRDFGNVCEMMLRNIFLNQTWSVLHEGKCECILNCSDEFDPICISRNGINYTIVNECFLNYGMCQDKRSTWKVLSKGECPIPFRRAIVDKYSSVAPGFRFTSNYGANVTPALDLGNVANNSTTTVKPSVTTQATTSRLKLNVLAASLVTSVTRRPCTKCKKCARHKASAAHVHVHAAATTQETHIMQLAQPRKGKCGCSKFKRSTAATTSTSTIPVSTSRPPTSNTNSKKT